MLGYFGDNIMAEVAKALGVELGEPFCVENSNDSHIDWFRLDITGAQHFSPNSRGFATLGKHKGDWCSADYILSELITGKRVRIRRTIEQGALFDVGT
jgi:hypothetical protein